MLFLLCRYLCFPEALNKEMPSWSEKRAVWLKKIHLSLASISTHPSTTYINCLTQCPAHVEGLANSCCCYDYYFCIQTHLLQEAFLGYSCPIPVHLLYFLKVPFCHHCPPVALLQLLLQMCTFSWENAVTEHDL